MNTQLIGMVNYMLDIQGEKLKRIHYVPAQEISATGKVRFKE